MLAVLVMIEPTPTIDTAPALAGFLDSALATVLGEQATFEFTSDGRLMRWRGGDDLLQVVEEK